MVRKDRILGSQNSIRLVVYQEQVNTMANIR